jgi:hypothetical protein
VPKENRDWITDCPAPPIKRWRNYLAQSGETLEDLKPSMIIGYGSQQISASKHYRGNR